MSLSLAKARWRCRRGMRELDLVLGAFLEREFAHLSSRDRQRLERLLDQSDPVLIEWLREPSSAGSLAGLVRRIAAGGGAVA